MAILHGSWVRGKTEGSFFIWGETWRKIGAIDLQEARVNQHNPFAMTEAELKTFLASLQQSGQLRWQLPETGETSKKKRDRARLKLQKRRKNHQQTSKFGRSHCPPKSQNQTIL